MTRIALIGAGAFGRVHAAALAQLGVATVAFDPDPPGVVTAQLESFLRAVARRVPQGPGLVEGGVAPMAILDAARRAAHEGRVVAVGEG